MRMLEKLMEAINEAEGEHKVDNITCTQPIISTIFMEQAPAG